MISRREFLKSTMLGAGLALFWRGDVLYARTSPSAKAVPLTEPGAILDPRSVPKFVTPLLVPPAMRRVRRLPNGKDKSIDYYEIAVRQFEQQILPAPLPKTTVWGYGPQGVDPSVAIFNAPSLTIEAEWGRPVRIKWINELVDQAGNYLPHLLPVDQTLHWANPPGGEAARDTHPEFAATPGPYTGPVPMIPHVHGAIGVGDESDGYAEAWYLPAAANIPPDYATKGTWYDFFAAKAQSKGYVAPGAAAWEPGTAVFQYPNGQRASTIWYHDHTLGMTRLNVYAGPAGFFLIRGGPDGEATDTRTGGKARLPGPAPSRHSMPNTRHYEIPIAIQDRAFNQDGSLFYPATRAFFDGIEGRFTPDTDVPPIWNPEFFGNVMMVNGATWPFLEVEQRRYRFRLLNGCNARFLIVDFARIPGAEVWQIGNEAGFLEQPVNLTAQVDGKLLMAPAERADLIVDFTQVPAGDYVLHNLGPDEPFGGGSPLTDFEPSRPQTTGQILQFRVGAAQGVDNTTPPQFLSLPVITPFANPSVVRRVALLEQMSAFFDDAPVEAVLGTVEGDPAKAPAPWTPRMWMDPITENPDAGATEVWEIYNATADAHPIHIHEVLFQVLDRQMLLIEEDARAFELAPGSTPIPPEPWERGYKDTVVAYPGQVTRLIARFESPGQFVWHCHIVEHEDNEMMRPYRIGPVQPGQPA